MNQDPPCCQLSEPSCAACVAEVRDLIAQFEDAVKRGVYNARGYTPAEWAAKVDRDFRAAQITLFAETV